MQKFIATILLILYCTLSIGASVNVHFCCSKISSVSFFDNQEKCCCSHNTSFESLSCCSDKTIEFDFKESDVQKQNTLNYLALFKFISSLNNVVKLGKPVTQGGDNICFNKPPPEKGSLYLIFCNLIFYG